MFLMKHLIYLQNRKKSQLIIQSAKKIIYIGDAITPCELANEANIPIMERGMFIVCWDHKLNKYRNEEQTKIWNITTKKLKFPSFIIQLPT